MNISHLLMGALLISSLPAVAQPENKPANGLPYRLVPVEEAIRLVQSSKKIMLHLHDVTLQDAFAELSKQSNMRLLHSGSNVDKALQSKVSIDLETSSFKEAFATLITQAGVKAELRKYPGSRTAEVVFGLAPSQENAPEESPFEIRLTSIRSAASKMVILGKNPRRTRSSEFSVALSAESGFYKPLLGPEYLRITQAVDDRGNALRLPAPVGIFPGLDRGVTTAIHLRTPAPESRTLKLEGVVVYIIPTQYEKWEVADVIAAQGMSHEFKSAEKKVNVTIKKAIPGKDSLQLELELSSLGGGFQLQRGAYSALSTEQITSALALKDADGQGLGNRGVSSRGDGGKVKVEISYVLPDQPTPSSGIGFGQPRPLADPTPPQLVGPISLTINVPVDFVQTEVPFSFSDIPLP